METKTMFWIAGVIVVLIIGSYIISKILNSKVEKGEEKEDGKGEILSEIEQEDMEPEPWANFDKNTPARESFIKNLNLFSPLLADLSDNKFNAQEWKEVIVSIKNYQLLNYWSKIKNRVGAWETILNMWGIKKDTCTEFVGVECYNETYLLDDGEKITHGMKCKVVKPAWILSEADKDGNVLKRVVCKGIAKRVDL